MNVFLQLVSGSERVEFRSGGHSGGGRGWQMMRWGGGGRGGGSCSAGSRQRGARCVLAGVGGSAAGLSFLTPGLKETIHLRNQTASLKNQDSIKPELSLRLVWKMFMPKFGEKIIIPQNSYNFFNQNFPNLIVFYPKISC